MLIPTIDQHYTEMPVGDLREHPENARRGNVAAIEESIERNGWYGVVVAQRSTGYILAGNHRHRAYKAKGATHVPTVLVNVDDKTALAILVGDNGTSDRGGYDVELLKATVASAREHGLAGTGWAEDDVAELLGEAGAKKHQQTAQRGLTPLGKYEKYAAAVHGRRINLVYELADHLAVGEALDRYASENGLKGRAEAVAHRLGVL